jgi:TonB-dependent receptor
MRRSLCSVFFVAILNVLLLIPARAQEGKGVISGAVKDSQNGALTGALVEIQPTGKRAVSDDQGQFKMPDVAAGDYTLTVTYVGFSPFTSTVKVAGGQTANVAPVLNVASQTDQVVVTAERLQGETEAINIERTAEDIVQVLPLKVITSLPNTNVADAVGRLPSVTLERDEGEGKYVQIRGTEPRLSNMTVNGVSVPPLEGNVRNVKMDSIPANLVDRIEVNKTLSANEDANAIGGTVNLVTKTAGEKAYYSFDSQGGYTPIQGGRTLGGFGGTAGKRFGVNKKLGILLGGTFDRNNRGIDDLEPGQTTGNFNGKNFAYVNTEDRRTYEYYRTRYGFDSAVDYNLSPSSSVYIKGFYSDFHDYGDVWVYTPNAGNTIESVTGSQVEFADSLECQTINQKADDPLQNGTPGANPCSPGSFQYRHYVRRPDQQTYSFLTGARHDLSTMLIHYEFAVSRAHNIGGQDFPATNFNGPTPLYSDDGTMIKNPGVDLQADSGNPYIPNFHILDGTNVFDPTTYSLANTSLTFYHTTQLNFQGSASVARRYTAGGHFGTFEVGFLGRNAHKTQFENDQYFNDNGSGITMAQTLGTYSNPTYYNKALPVGPMTDYTKILSLVNQNVASGGLSPNTAKDITTNAGATWDVNERVYAGYLMNSIQFGKVRLQTGVRFEGTEAGYLANQITKPIPPSTTFVVAPVSNRSSYVNVLPSIQLQYLLTPNTNVRAVFGMGIARANFQDQVPSIQVDPNTTPPSVQIGNQALKPTKANNYDLLVEHFFQPLGILQGGFFYKTLSDPIYLTTVTLTSGQFSGFQQQQSINGPSAHIAGFEMAWEQRLSRLPGLLNGLGVAANYSYTTSRATFPAGFNGGRTDHPALQRQAPNTWNLGFTYDKSRFSMRLGVSHNDANIYAYNYTTSGNDSDPILGIKGPLGDNYLYAHTQVDIQGSYRMYKGLSFVASGLNLTNEVFGFYFGSPIYPNQREFYKPSLIVGVRWSSAVE